MQSPTAGVRFDIPIQIIHLNPSSSGPQPRIELRRDGDLVFRLIRVAPNQGPTAFALTLCRNCDRIAVLRKVHRIVLQKLLLRRFAAPTHLSPNIHRHLTVGIRSNFDAAEIDIHDDGATSFDAEEVLVNSLLRRSLRRQRQYNYPTESK